MASRKLVRRRARGAAPVVRRIASPSVTAARAEARERMQGAGGLIVGGVRDPAETAADRVADRVMAMLEPAWPVGDAGAECAGGQQSRVQRREADEEETVRTRAAAGTVARGASAAPAPAAAKAAIGAMGAGRPLSRAERSFFEPRFGADFSRVRVHGDAAAASAARALDAHAFTLGHDIAFAPGERAPGTPRGDRVMAHELAHVVQNTASIGASAIRRTPVDAPSPYEIISPVWRVTGRDIVVVRIKADGRTFLFYKRTGEGPKGAGSAPPADTWAPFDGLTQRERLVRGTHRFLEPHFVKELYYQRYDAPELRGYGTQTNKNIADWLNRRSISAPESPDWRAVQAQLERYKPLAPLGVRQRHPRRGLATPSGGDPTEVRSTTSGTVAVPQKGSVTTSGGAVKPVTTTAGEITGPGRAPGGGGPGQGPAPRGAPPSTSGGGVQGVPPTTVAPTTPAPAAVQGGQRAIKPPAVSARDMAAEIARSLREARRLELTTRAVRYGLGAWQVVSALYDIAKSVNMATAILAQVSPFEAEVRHANSIESTAKEIAQHYGSLNLLDLRVPEDNPSWGSFYDVYQFQLTFLSMEQSFHEALKEVQTARSNIEKQMNSLRDEMAAKVAALPFAMTSAAHAEVLLFADAGGKINPRLQAAAKYYTMAENALMSHRGMTRALAQWHEMRLRELGSSGVFWKIPSHKIRSTPLEKFTFRG